MTLVFLLLAGAMQDDWPYEAQPNPALLNSKLAAHLLREKDKCERLLLVNSITGSFHS